jgi:hypothetical protein
MKKTYLSPKLEISKMFDVIMMSTPDNLGDGDWGVKDVL